MVNEINARETQAERMETSKSSECRKEHDCAPVAPS